MYVRGHEVDTPRGQGNICTLEQFVTLDLSGECPECGHGVRQVGPVRLAAAALNRCTAVTILLPYLDTGAWHLVDARVVDTLDPRLWSDVELREVEQIGRGDRRTRWFQVIPRTRIPPRLIVNSHRELVECSRCDGWWWEPKRDAQGHPLPEISFDKDGKLNPDYPRLYHGPLDDVWSIGGYVADPWPGGSNDIPSRAERTKYGELFRVVGIGGVYGPFAVEQFARLKDRRIGFDPYVQPIDVAPPEVREKWERQRSRTRS